MLSLVGAASLMVCWQGRHIDGLYETYQTEHHAGTLIQDLERLLYKAQVPHGARLAYVDSYEASKSHAAYLPPRLS